MKTRLAIIPSLLVTLLCATATAQTYKSFPGVSADQRTLHTQERVEQLYVEGDYRRALLIYRKELAPIGDKYAQYMVGYMHLNAQGVEQDKATALAWYRLAAERKSPVLERAHDELRRAMTPEEIAHSDRIFAELWQDIGDLPLIVDLIRRDMDILKARTGSRIPGSSASGPAVIFRPSGEPLGPNFYRNVRARLEARLAYLDSRVEITDIDRGSALAEIRDLEQAVKAELAALDIP